MFSLANIRVVFICPLLAVSIVTTQNFYIIQDSYGSQGLVFQKDLGKLSSAYLKVIPALISRTKLSLVVHHEL